ncbi:hypothetical protein HanRHA438_Chr14g0652201 [Helianthus annuus]|nr:hypothetical protein HanRHA438_Chr14g0652201 [Helianthus annuus]
MTITIYLRHLPSFRFLGVFVLRKKAFVKKMLNRKLFNLKRKNVKRKKFYVNRKIFS